MFFSQTFRPPKHFKCYNQNYILVRATGYGEQYNFSIKIESFRTAILVCRVA